MRLSQVAPRHEVVHCDDILVFLIAAAKAEQAVFTTGLAERRVLSAVLDHIGRLRTGSSLMVQHRDVEVVGVALALGGLTLRGHD